VPLFLYYTIFLKKVFYGIGVVIRDISKDASYCFPIQEDLILVWLMAWITLDATLNTNEIMASIPVVLLSILQYPIN
jgi:hypothetical protein